MIGSNIAHYRVTAKLGEGGMGEVWRAEDTKLGRAVAIKVLPPSLAADPARLARSQREAEVLAALNHPNIAAIYGIEDIADTKALVMELVEGPTLADRLAAGPIPVEESLTIAKQIAAALEDAHEQGIVHRDLKPANVKVRPDGTVKVLDFGLAKALSEDAAERPVDPSRSPTVTMGATAAGVILGTAAYMAPEQAAGTAADRRADVWAFGVVLWEMLAGRRLFDGETVTHILASVMKDDPDLERLPADTPPAIRRLVARCLRRQRRQRLQAIGDARVVIEDVLEDRGLEVPSATPTVATHRTGWRSYALPALAVVALTAANAWLWLGRSPDGPGRPVTRLIVPLPEDAPVTFLSYPGHSVAIARDGTTIAYQSRGSNGRPESWVRRLDDLTVRPLENTEDGLSQPFFSPDGDWVAGFTNTSLRKVPLHGGRPVTLVRDLAASGWFRGSWSDDGRIVYDTWNGGLRVVSADGGTPEVLTEPAGEWHLGPQMLPGSETFLFFVQTATSYRIEAMRLDGSSRQVVLEDASHPVYLASGHLQFVREGNPMVVRFDADALRIEGSPVPLDVDVHVDHVNVGAPIPQLAVALDGTLVYAPAPAHVRDDARLVWVDRAGNVEPFATVPFWRPHFDLSRDGTRLTVSGRAGPQVRYEIMDVSRKTLTPSRTERLDYPTPAFWSHDASEIFFSRFGTHESELLVEPAGGGPPVSLLTIQGTWMVPIGNSPDGRYVVFFVYDPETAGDIWYLDRQAAEGEEAVRPFRASSADEVSAALSPDGRWLAYVSSETGDYALYVSPFPGGETRVRVASGDEWGPLWSPDGKELFYRLNRGEDVMAVSVTTAPELRLGEPRRLFSGNFQDSADVGYSWDVHPDGDRFLMVVEPDTSWRTDRLVVVQNWFADVERLLSR